ncbi:hypothetical protein GQ457_09G023190 [Hibiscus cannabinus]
MDIKKFSKESERHIKEEKLKIFLIRPPESPVLTAINGDLCRRVENIPPSQKGYRLPNNYLLVLDYQFFDDDAKELTVASNLHSNLPKDVQGLKCTKEMKLDDDFEDLKLKINFMDSKFKEAEVTIMKLTQQMSNTTKEKDKLQSELEALRTKSTARRTTQVDFPFLYVCMVANISLVIECLGNL